MKKVILACVLFCTTSIESQQRLVPLTSASKPWNTIKNNCNDCVCSEIFLTGTCMGSLASIFFCPWYLLPVPLGLSVATSIHLASQIYHKRRATEILNTVPFSQLETFKNIGAKTFFDDCTQTKQGQKLKKEFMRLKMLQKGMKDGLFAKLLKTRIGKHIPQEIMDIIFKNALEGCQNELDTLTISISRKDFDSMAHDINAAKKLS